MIKSMTAYGRAEVEEDGKRFVCELKSLNHRFKDIHLRLPRNLQALEEELRAVLALRIGRGRVEASIQMDQEEELAYHLKVNEPLVESYKGVLKRLAEEFEVDSNISLDSLCQLKDIIIFEPESPDIEALKPILIRVLNEALESLDEMRIREGQNILNDFLERLDRIETYVNEVEGMASQIVQEYKKRLEEKISQMTQGMEIDEARMTQEVAFFAERADIAEEIVRIRSHIAQFREYLSVHEPVGRRLDFLIQEINREINTLSTKSSNATVSRIAVEVKGELERLREQVQNVE